MSTAAVSPGKATAAARIRVGFIVGPTGAGKSALAIEVAERVDSEIVNADSRLLYRGLDIGTAKPSAEARRRVPHHLIDVCDPGRPIDVASFGAMVKEAIADITRRGRHAIVTGGSGLYLRVIQRGIFAGPRASAAIRERLRAIAMRDGAADLHSRLRAIDPAAAARIDHNDLFRIVRALEVYELTGTPISVHHTRHALRGGEYNCLTIGLEVPRDELYAAIDRRVDEMIAAGLIDEVQALLTANVAPDAPPLSTIGYRQICAHLRGECTLADAIAIAKRDTRRLAKRQLTWLRRDADTIWLDPAGAADKATTLFADFFAGRD